MIAAFIFSIVMMARSNFLTNVGFLVLGALVAIFTTLLGDLAKRPVQARDLARALYEELADRVARCCFDYEAPWQKYSDPDGYQLGSMNSFRLRKFLPIAPIIYSASASQLALLDNQAPQALIKFYYRLAAWQRDVENIATESQHNKGGLAPDAVQFLAQRLYQTLIPGLRALEALSSLVEGHELIEAAAIAGYDEFRKGFQPKGTLRDRIVLLTGSLPHNGL